MLIVLLATVVVPVLMLSALGFIAVKNERAALEREVALVFEPRLEELATTLSAQASVDPDDAQRSADATWGADGTRYRLEPVGSGNAVVSRRLRPPHDAWQVG